MPEFEIDLKQYQNKPINIGGVISLNLEKIDKNRTTYFMLQICNDTMHGQYMIPSAIGFSTPLSMLGDLKNTKIIITKNIFGVSETIPDSLIMYNEWIQTYKDTIYTVNPEKVVYSTDKQNCSICLEDYKIGDELFKLRLCGHYFHQKCLENISLRTTCPICRCHSSRFPTNNLTNNQRIELFLSEM